MIKNLHITNQKNLVAYIKKIDPIGQVILWKEILSDGKTTPDFGTKMFWKNRYSFLHKYCNVSKKSFIADTLRAFQDICKAHNALEITLWFNADLSSQINMLGLLSWIYRYRKNTPISVVFKLQRDLYSIFKLQYVYKTRLQLTPEDITFSNYIWQLYCGKDPMALEVFTRFNASSYDFLPELIKAHLQRYPSVINGLNPIEQTILADTILCQKRKTLYKHAQDKLRFYGISTIQYKKIIQDLSPLLLPLSKGYALTQKAKLALADKYNVYQILKKENAYLGGSKRYDFLWNPHTERLLKL